MLCFYYVVRKIRYTDNLLKLGDANLGMQFQFLSRGCQRPVDRINTVNHNIITSLVGHQQIMVVVGNSEVAWTNATRWVVPVDLQLAGGLVDFKTDNFIEGTPVGGVEVSPVGGDVYVG